YLAAAELENGSVIRRLETPSAQRVMSESVADVLSEGMHQVVERGLANGMRIDGVRTAGKTGTAETGVDGVSHAWFIAFAPVDDPVVAVAVIVENGGRGGEVAGPIAGDVIRAALNR